jgi:hypothetical protein
LVGAWGAWWGLWSGPLLGACSTWASVGLGVDSWAWICARIWASGRRGGWGLWWVFGGRWGLWWGLGGRGGGQGGDVVVVEFLMPDGSTCTYTKTTSKKPRHATKSKLHADSDCFTCTRATRANPNPNPKPKPPVVGIECAMDDVRCARVRCGVRRLLAGAGGWPPPPPHTTDHRPQ